MLQAVQLLAEESRQLEWGDFYPMKLFKIFYLVFLSLFISLNANPDLSIVGFIMPEDGLGKIPINILETISSDINANTIATNFKPPIKENLSESVLKAINNPDKTAGKVAIFTESVCSLLGNNYLHLPKDSFIKIAYSMFEADRIPGMWVRVLNKEFDAIIVPDEYCVEVYENSGINLPIFVLPIPMILRNYLKHIPKNSSNYPFVFGDASANKNPEVLVKAFALAFGDIPSVHLVLRAGNISKQTLDLIQPIIDEYKLNNITIEKGHLLLEPYIQRLKSFDCYVNLSCGEGFSFIPREALALGIPVIITNNTASKTICDSGFVYAVRSDKKIKSKSNVYRILFSDDCGDQFDCEVEDAKNALLEVYYNYPYYLQKALEGRDWVCKYDCKDETLRRKYTTLVKPIKVMMGEFNEVREGVIVTNSKPLYEKYVKIIGDRNAIAQGKK